jgi:predicted nuclease of predicted toxin-antitoxin system
VRFLADMGVSMRVVEWLRSTGHDVVHLREQGLHRLPDGEIFAKAQREQRVVLTFDLDFGEIVAATGVKTPSVSCSGSRTRGASMSSAGLRRFSRGPPRM